MGKLWSNWGGTSIQFFQPRMNTDEHRFKITDRRRPVAKARPILIVLVLVPWRGEVQGRRLVLEFAETNEPGKQTGMLTFGVPPSGGQAMFFMPNRVNAELQTKRG
jgi:hypothetical protein